MLLELASEGFSLIPVSSTGCQSTDGAVAGAAVDPTGTLVVSIGAFSSAMSVQRKRMEQLLLIKSEYKVAGLCLWIGNGLELMNCQYLETLQRRKDKINRTEETTR